jgi:hypothetical protein
VAWSLPGTHIPNQFVAQVIGVGAKLEAAAFWNHAIILGYYDTDLGLMLATPSRACAQFSGNPNLYYHKYSWSDLDVSFYLESAQSHWSERELAFKYCNPRL